MKALEAGKINAVGYKFIEKCINTIEERGLEEEGLYRRPGVLAKASKLFKESGDKSVVDGLDFTDDIEFDTKTLASAVKGYFAKYLGEPVMTHALHHKFIETAKINDLERKTQAIKELIYQLPKGNIDLLSMLIAHLKNVADMCNYNLMKASNLGVCFGPTLMRPEHETVASIVDIRYQNIIVEFLILNVEEIFPGAKACRPYPRPKGMKQEGETFTQSDSYVVKRRPPPAAPSKRISAVDFMKRSQETRSHSNTVSTSSTSNSSSSFGRQANSSNLMTSQKYDRSATMPGVLT
jgi:Rho GTPase-activating protein 10